MTQSGMAVHIGRRGFPGEHALGAIDELLSHGALRRGIAAN